MYAIKRKYHYGFNILTPTVYGHSKLLCGQTVDVVVKGNDLAPVHFGGFLSQQALEHDHINCSVTNILAFSNQGEPYLTGWHEFNPRTTFAGVRINESVFLLIHNSQLIQTGLYSDTPKAVTNVANLFGVTRN